MTSDCIQGGSKIAVCEFGHCMGQRQVGMGLRDCVLVVILFHGYAKRLATGEGVHLRALRVVLLIKQVRRGVHGFFFLSS
jgi:hypothetical protein